MSLILIVIICWVFVIACLISGSRIRYVLPSEKDITSPIFFIVLGVIIAIRFMNEVGYISILYGALVGLSGVVYSIIPTGYDDNAVYIKGRKFLYTKMKSMEINEEDSCYRMTFVVHTKPHFVAVDKKDIHVLKDIEMKYRKVRIFK